MVNVNKKRTCDICGRFYKLIPLETRGLDEWAIGWDTSNIRVRLREPNTTKIVDHEICKTCANKLLKYIWKMKEDAPKKCEFCEHDKGPKYGEQNHPGCEGCVKYSNFQLRTRPMTQIQQYRWEYWNGEVD